VSADGLSRLPVSRFQLESGEVLDEVGQAYRLLGALSPERDNLVLLFHSLTGDTDAEAWWEGVVGPGLAVDTERFAVLVPNLLGSCYGTTYRRAPGAPGPRPSVTTRDQARLAGHLLDALGVEAVVLVAGGSLGGMATLEFAATFPERAAAAVAFAAPAVQSAWAAGWNQVQRRAIELGGTEGLALARMAGMLTYRTPDEFDGRFLGKAGSPEPHAVQSYLRRHGEKLVARFDAESYLTLMDAMDAHDVGRGRGGVAAALRAFRGRLVGVGIPGDVLYRAEEVRGWTAEAGGAFRSLASPHGHDGFLLEREAVARIVSVELRPAPLAVRGGWPAALPAASTSLPH
jgi:homoserine O-acetyltransferase/O-succinyltransferase